MARLSKKEELKKILSKHKQEVEEPETPAEKAELTIVEEPEVEEPVEDTEEKIKPVEESKKSTMKIDPLEVNSIYRNEMLLRTDEQNVILDRIAKALEELLK